LEERSPLAVRREVAAPTPCVLAGDLAQSRYVGGEAVELGIDHRVRAKRGHDVALPPRCADLRVVRERVERRFRRGEDLDVEALEQRARGKRRWGETVVDGL